jgi:hypothetical protein
MSAAPALLFLCRKLPSHIQETAVGSRAGLSSTLDPVLAEEGISSLTLGNLQSQAANIRGLVTVARRSSDTWHCGPTIRDIVDDQKCDGGAAGMRWVGIGSIAVR